MALPIVQDPNQNLMLVQQKWKSQLDPLFKNQNVNGNTLTNIQLNVGSTTIPHNLGNIQKGWFITDIQGSVTSLPYRSGPFNNTNLVLTSPQAVIISLWVF